MQFKKTALSWGIALATPLILAACGGDNNKTPASQASRVPGMHAGRRDLQ
jgi:hypothetical protein